MIKKQLEKKFKTFQNEYRKINEFPRKNKECFFIMRDYLLAIYDDHDLYNFVSENKEINDCFNKLAHSKLPDNRKDILHLDNNSFITPEYNIFDEKIKKAFSINNYINDFIELHECITNSKNVSKNILIEILEFANDNNDYNIKIFINENHDNPIIPKLRDGMLSNIYSALADLAKKRKCHYSKEMLDYMNNSPDNPIRKRIQKIIGVNDFKILKNNENINILTADGFKIKTISKKTLSNLEQEKK